MEDGFPLRVVEGRWPEGDGEDGGDRGEDGDHLEDALPVLGGGELVEEEAGGCNLCNCNVFSSPSAQCSVFQLFRVERKMEIFPTEKPIEEESKVSARILCFLKYRFSILEHPELSRASPGPRKTTKDIATFKKGLNQS